MWISRRSAISSPFLSTCRAEKRFYTASADSCHGEGREGNRIIIGYGVATSASQLSGTPAYKAVRLLSLNVFQIILKYDKWCIELVHRQRILEPARQPL